MILAQLLFFVVAMMDPQGVAYLSRLVASIPDEERPSVK